MTTGEGLGYPIRDIQDAFVAGHGCVRVEATRDVCPRYLASKLDRSTRRYCF